MKTEKILNYYYNYFSFQKEEEKKKRKNEKKVLTKPFENVIISISNEEKPLFDKRI